MNGNAKQKEMMPETEVIATAQRKQYCRAYKEGILEEIDEAREPGAMGAILRREGLYSQIISKWRAQRQAGFPGSGLNGRAHPTAVQSAQSVLKVRCQLRIWPL